MRVIVEGKLTEVRAVWFEKDTVRMIDQRILPLEFKILSFYKCSEVIEAIRNMTVRGAPSIGAAAAYGLTLGALRGDNLETAANMLRRTRPTANDLFYAVDYMLNAIASGKDPVTAANAYADAIVEKCKRIGKHGSSLIKNDSKVMTHCNAGALASVDVGTALAPLRIARDEGKNFFVYVSETRPRLQGMRLTSWELLNEGIPHAIIADAASGHYMKKDVDVIIVGADRIASNGDFANKIGTFEKAVLAKELGIPFYVAAPVSTFDFSIESGDEIPIESRSEDEVMEIEGRRIAPDGASALNPAFDVTPNKYVTGFITEIGILKPSEISKMKIKR